MCLAVPSKIVEIKDNNVAIVDIGGVKKEILIDLLDEVKVGEYVLLHAGFAIQKLDEEEARKTLEIFREISLLGER